MERSQGELDGQSAPRNGDAHVGNFVMKQLDFLTEDYMDAPEPPTSRKLHVWSGPTADQKQQPFTPLQTPKLLHILEDE